MENLVINKLDNGIVVEVQKKRLDAAFAVKFRDDVLAIIQQGHNKIVFNLNQVEFMDSSGLGSLVSVMKALGGNQNMVLCNVKDAVLTVFKLTRMDKIFVITASEADAITRLS